ncbi:MAG: hypothetical protein ABGX20_14705 [Bacillus sp. (in: firmicutes)]
MKKVFLSLVLLLGLSVTISSTMPSAEAKNSESGIVNTGYWKLINGYWYHYTWIGKSYGWIIYNNKSYFLDITSGAMWKGRWYRDLGSGKWYYLQNDGVMKTGWFLDKGNWYYLDPKDGEMKTGWLYNKGYWYYLDKSGAMVTGWLPYNGQWYYLQSSGAMRVGWLLENGNWYYLYKDGNMAFNTEIDGYKIIESGKAFRNYTPDELVQIAEDIAALNQFEDKGLTVDYDEESDTVYVTATNYNTVIAAAGNGFITGSDQEYVTTLANALGAPLKPTAMKDYWDKIFQGKLEAYEDYHIGMYRYKDTDWIEMYWGIWWEY